MTLSLPTIQQPGYAIAEKALRRWAAERLQQRRRQDGATVYSFAMSGSTCNNMGVPLEAVMTVMVDADGRIRSATSSPSQSDNGCDAMCAAGCDGRRFLADVGTCNEVLGLTLHEAAFRDWQTEPSGCFCTAGNRRHKWKNVFQTIHFAITSEIA
jgi:hypothetical protein